MKEKQLVKVKPETKAITINSPAEMIRMAVAGKADLDKLEKLLAIQERWDANEAKKAYYKAMTAFKSNLPQIMKDKKVNYAAGGGNVRYNYASLFNIVDKVTPELSKFGLSVAWFHKQETGLTVTCRITHELGYSEETSLTGPADKTGSKNDIQALGSTNSYLERYTFLALLGTATKDQDDDGISICAVEFISDSQLNQLLDAVDNNKINKPKFLAYLKIDKFEHLPKSDFQKAMTAAQNIVKGGKP